MGDIPVCWRCGAGLDGLSLPLARLDECPACSVQVHVCRMCSFFDPAVSRSCREDDAEEVREKDRANFCDYFTPRPDAYDARFTAADQVASTALDRLFASDADEQNSPEDPPQQAADDLFK